MGLLLAMVLQAGATVTGLGSPSGSWPLGGAPHALATADRARVLHDVQALPPAERVRVLHDWVVLHLRYELGGDQRVAEVLKRGTASCDGYSALFADLAARSGFEVRVVRGELAQGVDAPQPHAWNVVKLEGAWQVVDVTLDDPVLRGDAAGDVGYRTDYLLVPAEVAALDHWPFDPVWQLGAKRLSRAAFRARRPTTNAVLLRTGVEVVDHSLGPTVRVTVRNPRGLHLLLAVDGARCAQPEAGEVLELSCPSPSEHARVEVLANDAPIGLFLSIVELR
jgi:Transglutaminase-like superfamily